MIETKVIDKIKEVFDPEIPVNIYDLGLVYDVFITEQGDVQILMTLTSPSCPVAESLPEEVKHRVMEVQEVGKVEVEMTWDPPWNRELMSDEAKLALGFL
ncbi:SUF system Fe-S cluster assembly protein [Muricauda sp. CAU 1633]|uniref:SUF system Fe-S cluster assembly protein n=1 Tax=Allomuricauda sp. CAU 1633 TaxID=2816036 RepID=UPI001A8F8986|nr:SUF system Fe-S cluster assembly protein [Muricauda sp. CAU 1633]MBO0323780.1 SUF system Fe-S cluster assembly protein [Muricauda sp. CAU 1633]